MGNHKGELNSNWTGGKKLEKECKLCGKLFNVWECNSHIKYCSKACFYNDPNKDKRRMMPKKRLIKSLRSDEILDEILSGVDETRHNQLLDEYYKL